MMSQAQANESSRLKHTPPAPSLFKDSPPAYTVDGHTNIAAFQPEADTLSAAFTNLTISNLNPQFPDSQRCLVHLKLLSALHTLKEDIGYTDGLFGLEDALCENAHSRDQALSKLREKRWSLYVARAVDRFETWWTTVACIREPCRRLQCRDMLAGVRSYYVFPESGIQRQWTQSMLPPLDVLMVWHAFMLNPRDYLEDCLRFGLKDLWTTGLPWAAVDAAIVANFNYFVPDDGMVDFIAKTGLNWDNAEDSSTKDIICPVCSQQLRVPWTTCGRRTLNSSEALDTMNGCGYGDRAFETICPKCQTIVNHNLLRVAKFKRDTEGLIMHDFPLGGTILSPKDGAPDAGLETKLHKFPTTFPNRLVKEALRSPILEIFKSSPPVTGIEDVKTLIEAAIKDRNLIRMVNKLKKHESAIIDRESRLSIRKMMSRYWDNSSIFALELGGAVMRQGVFVEKMYSLDWLHSPTANETMRRLLIKYSRFIEIMSTYPRNVCVPTLDVDLGWHTHQLCPQQYYQDTMAKCKKFIDHDDKMKEETLSSGFEWTSKMYEKHYQEVYSECTCWYCEAIRSTHVSKTAGIFGTSKHEKIANGFHDSPASLHPPSQTAHISSHPSVSVIHPLDPVQSRVTERLRAAREAQLESAYRKACKRAHARGRPIPERNAYETGAAWGYPYVLYGPYIAPPYIGGMYYAGDPCVMPLGTGVAGNCAAGTCGGGIAAGACGGPGGCGGSGAGGCGGGGGACGGGGGGGGCGGGGGGGGGGCGGGGGG